MRITKGIRPTSYEQFMSLRKVNEDNVTINCIKVTKMNCVFKKNFLGDLGTQHFYGGLAHEL
jgi:hypothetical protein